MTRILVVGCGQVCDGALADLSQPANDAELMEAILGDSIDYDDVAEVRRVVNPDRARLFDDLGWLAQGEGLGVFYFSGHGVRNRGSSALVLADDQDEEGTRFVHGTELAARFRYSDQRQLLILLDCCFAEGIAVEVAAGARNGGPSIFALVATDVLTLAHAAGSLPEQRVPGARADVSPFTRALALALKGLGTSAGSHTVDLGEVFGLVSAEAVRCGFPGPALLRSGTAEEPSIQFSLPRDPRIGDRLPWRFDILLGTSHAQDNGPRWVIGSDGARSFAAASAVAGRGVRNVLDARNAVTIGVSRYRNGPSGRGGVYTGIEEPDWGSLVGEAAGRERVILVSSTAPADTEAEIYRVPNLAIDDVLRVIANPTHSRIARVEESFDEISSFAGDSLELAMVATTATLTTADSASLPLIERVTRLFADQMARPEKRGAYDLLTYASGSYFSRERFAAQLAVEYRLTTDAALKSIDELVDSGLVQRRGRWVRGTALANSVPGDDVASKFRNLADDAVAHGRADVRLQTFIAVGALAGREAKLGSISDPTIDLLVAYGRDLLDCAGPANMLWLLQRVIEIRNDDVPTPLLIHRGDALRLMDDYESAETTFRKAMERAESVQDRARARVGLISAGKNSRTDDVRLEALLGAGPDGVGAGSDRFDSTSARVLAYEFHHAGTVRYARSDWAGAIEFFRRGVAVLDGADPGHAGVLLDLLKGEADILHHRGETGAAGHRLSDAFAVASDSGIVFLDIRAHAKLMQFAGDHARHRCAHSDSRTPRLLNVARWWYRRSAQTFAGGGLALGSLISQYRLSQCDLVAGELHDAQFGFTDLWGQFRELKNPLWEYKCAVMLCVAAQLDRQSAMRSVGDAAEYVGEQLTQKLSPYQTAWGQLALSDSRADVRRIAAAFETVGAVALAELLAQGFDSRVGCFY